MKKVVKKTILKNVVRLLNRRLMDLVKKNPEYRTWYQTESRKWLDTLINNFTDIKDESDPNYREKLPKNYNIYKPGNFYCYSYTSKLYEQGKLDYFDGFPLIFVLAKNSEYFLGVNFHHMSIPTRLYVINKLKQYYKERFDNDNYLLPMNYDIFMRIIGKAKKDALFCTRKYLKTQVNNFHGMKYMRIPNQDIENACLFSSPKLFGISPANHKKIIMDNKSNIRGN